jgi:hypothetical protein
MAETSITTRALTYRDPTVTATAETQLRRNRQRALESLEDQARRTAGIAGDTAQQERSKADSYRAAQDAADGNDITARSDRPSEIQSNQTRSNQANTATADEGGESTSAQHNVADEGDGQSHAPFTTQVIAQEYMGEGLHVPPLQPADEAYRRAGAEPPLINESSTSGLVSLAI